MREVRTFAGAVQIRAKKTDSDKPGATGYAAVFNQVADIGWFKETIMPGAFSRAIAENQDVRCLQNHNNDLILGRTKNGTLGLAEDNYGLKFLCEFPTTSVATDLHVLVARGDIDQCSFGFIVIKDTWKDTYDDNGRLVDSLRTILDVDLFDVSIVTFPAHDGTSAEARSKLLFPEGMPPEVRTRCGLDDADACAELELERQRLCCACGSRNSSKVLLEALGGLFTRVSRLAAEERKLGPLLRYVPWIAEGGPGFRHEDGSGACCSASIAPTDCPWARLGRFALRWQYRRKP
jgi:HK97 family phage prohead protease